MKKSIFVAAFILAIIAMVSAQSVQYPYPQKQFRFQAEGKESFMAYMDGQPEHASGQTIILFHGKNFSGHYWKGIIPFLLTKGYRIIAPDFPGWGRSAKPDLHYSFHLLASINKSLLDSLHIDKVFVLGHSMGGMVAARFTLMFPSLVEKLVLENPIGLEDYKTFVPYQSLDKLYQKEKSATYDSYKKYQQGYYPEWKSEYEQYVKAQAEVLGDPGFDSIARVNAVTYQMIYEQPVVYELNRIKVPTLLIIGQADRTVVGKDQLTDDQKKLYGQYPQLGRKTAASIKQAKLVELDGVGHIPHVQEQQKFLDAVLAFL